MHLRWNVTEERYQQVLVALSESVMKIRLKRPLAAKSRWRHIRHSIKPRYLGSHASQIKSSMEHYQEVMVALSESVKKNRVKHPLADKSWWRHIRLTIKLRYIRNFASQLKVTMEHYQEVMVALSESIMKNCRKRSLTAKWWWRDILLVIKACNHASQMKSCYGSLLGSLGRLVIFIKKTANIISKNSLVYKCC